jgi:glycine cleavage system H protein
MALRFPDDCRYADSHEYLRAVSAGSTAGAGDGAADGPGDRWQLGLSAFAIDQLGDIVFVELPAVGAELTKGQSFGSVESVKAVEELIAPVTGVVIERNELLFDSPETLQNDPYGEGWLLVISPGDPAELDSLLDAASYGARVEGH